MCSLCNMKSTIIICVIVQIVIWICQVRQHSKLQHRLQSTMVKHAICHLPPYGFVKFSQVSENLCKVRCHLDDLSPGLHGMHVHEFGDLTGGCDTTCHHYNPERKSHGGPMGCNRHRGDLGNIHVHDNEFCSSEFHANVNVFEIIGRALIIHENEDDLGMGKNEESKKTGNAGKRIACGVIGISK